MTSRECNKLVLSGIYNNYNDCKCAFQLIETPENIKIKRTAETILPGSTTVKRVAVECSKQKYLGSVKIKVLLESITYIFRVLSEYYNRKIAREYYNPKYCQEVPQTSQSLRTSGSAKVVHS